MGASVGPKLSGMQKQVLALYRGFLRAARTKSPEERIRIESMVSAEFRQNSKQVDRKNFLYIEYLLRRASAATCHPDDEAGLLSFKLGITADPSNMLGTWKEGTDCCNWNGITCLVDNRVTAIYLTGQINNGTTLVNTTLSGTISPSLSKLKYLDGIYLLNLRSISGSFPNFVFSLPNFKYIYIENNKLSGQIPVNVGKLTKLEALSVEGNLFS
ncbi:Leucine-rich repeat (LRR) family, partial [Olea europaea subsp. europaea]